LQDTALVKNATSLSQDESNSEAFGKAMIQKVDERARLSRNSNGILMVAVNSRLSVNDTTNLQGPKQYLKECGLAAAMLRARGSRGLDGQNLHITLVTDSDSWSEAIELGAGHLGLVDQVINHTSPGRSWKDKLNAFLQTPYDYTLYLDCDVLVMQKDAPGDLLELSTDGVNDIVVTEDWGQAGTQAGGQDAYNHGRAGFCSCIIAFANLSATRAVWQKAMQLLDGTAASWTPLKPPLRYGDQEALWLVLEAMDWKTNPVSKRILPLEWQCPTAFPAEGMKLDILLPRPCRFVHYHPWHVENITRGDLVREYFRSQPGQWNLADQNLTNPTQATEGTLRSGLTNFEAFWQWLQRK
jgi:hypothetical protein